MNFVELHLRAWQTDAGSVHVLVHSSPAGSMRRPEVVAVTAGLFERAREAASAQWIGRPGTLGWVKQMGQELASVLLPPVVADLLRGSWEQVGPKEGLRFRLCLDEALIDLPWEFLALPEIAAHGPESLSGFIVQNRQLSLVREVPITCPPARPGGQQRMVFAAATGPGAEDPWGVRDEGLRLAQELVDVRPYRTIENYSAEAGQLEAALARPAAVFHYYGHTDAVAEQGFLVCALSKPILRPGVLDPAGVVTLSSERLSELLGRARVRLAVFCACNSGRWPFVRPLLGTGVEAVVGAQGIVSVKAGLAFSSKLYAALAVGLSLDEAVIAARLHVFDSGVSPGAESCEWGAFMVYLPAAEAVLFPRTGEEAQVQVVREKVRKEAERSAGKRELRKAMLDCFSAPEVKVLVSDLREDLTRAGRAAVAPVGLEDGPLEYQVCNLIEFLDRRGCLEYLQSAVRRERPQITLRA